MGHALTTKIRVKDAAGRVIEEKEVALYAGLLARAHEEGLKAIVTELIQVPHRENGGTAIAKAQVTTGKGTFTGIGDASPENVARKIAPHIIRMAETRAKARALRDAVNIGMVCLDELGGEDADRPARDDRLGGGDVRELRAAREREPPPANRRDAPERSDAMSDAQRRLMFRILSEEGFEGDAATNELLRRAEVRAVGEISKRYASQLIDRWKNGSRAA